MVNQIVFFANFFHEKFSSYLFQLIPPSINVYAIRSSQSKKIPSFKSKHNFFKCSFFPAVITEWNNLDINIQNSSFINIFQKELQKCIRPEPSFYNIRDTKWLKLLNITTKFYWCLHSSSLTEIQLSINQVNLNDLIVSLLFYS